MLQIDKEQMNALEVAALQSFEDATVAHVRGFASKHYEVIGEAGVRQVIRLGITRAKRYGFTNHGPVRLHIELMFMFGSDFDTDPLLPWASSALQDSESSDQMELAMDLHDAMMDYIERVVGLDRKPSIRALHRVYEASMNPVPPLGRPDIEDAALSFIELIFPERYEYLGEGPLRALIRRGSAIAERCQLSTERGVSLSILLSYLLGHGFASDPLFPWIERTLLDPRLRTVERRVKRLECRLVNYLGQALKYLEQE